MHMVVMNRKLKAELMIVKLLSPVLSVVDICMSSLGPYPELVTLWVKALCLVRGQ